MRNPRKACNGFYQTQTLLKVLARNASFSRKVSPVSTGGLHDCPMGESVRIFTLKMKGCIWGKCENLTMSLLKTDVFDRRFIRPEPYPMEIVVRGACSEAKTENWGISFALKYATNRTAAITVVRNMLNCAIEGARHLGVDQNLIAGWKEVADHLPPFPRYHMGMGDILGGNSGAIPRWTAGDHGHFTASYTVAISDEVNLDSTQEDKDRMIRSMDCVRCEVDDAVYSLPGALKECSACGYNYAAQRIVDEKHLAAELVKVPERLMNGRSGRIHLFPALPDGFPVAFRGFLPRGGFELSAARHASGVTGVVIKARRRRP
jgi:hypothetical protein